LEHRAADALEDELRAADAELAAAIERGDLAGAIAAVDARRDRMVAIARDRISGS
jgi:hypothetical protein